jgi:hypothetical protein
MGLADWIGGAKCSECGLKIQGPKFSRMTFGTTVWVCVACEEKLKAEQKKDLESAALRAQIQQAAAIRERSNADIALVLARNAMNGYGAFAKEVRQTTDGEISLNPFPAFMYVLAAASYVFRASIDPPFESVRIERLEETLARYALAGFIHITIRNPPTGAGTQAMDRAALLAQSVAQYLQVSEVHRGNIAIAVKAGNNDLKAVLAHLGGLGANILFSQPEKFAEYLLSDKEKYRLLNLCILHILTRTFNLQAPMLLQLAANTTRVNREIAVELPDSWLLRQIDPWFLYCDPGTPQYNLAISVHAVSSGDSAVEVVRKGLLTTAPDGDPVPLGPSRAMAHYRIAGVELGEAKDDHHWILAEKQDSRVRWALFTLSVLPGRADSIATDALVAMLAPRIQESRFLES